jgi:hypothetical protein
MIHFYLPLENLESNKRSHTKFLKNEISFRALEKSIVIQKLGKLLCPDIFSYQLRNPIYRKYEDIFDKWD